MKREDLGDGRVDATGVNEAARHAWAFRCLATHSGFAMEKPKSLPSGRLLSVSQATVPDRSAAGLNATLHGTERIEERCQARRIARRDPQRAGTAELTHEAFAR